MKNWIKESKLVFSLKDNAVSLLKEPYKLRKHFERITNPPMNYQNLKWNIEPKNYETLTLIFISKCIIQKSKLSLYLILIDTN